MKKNTEDKCLLTNVIETELDIVKRHVEILKTLQKNQPMGIIKLSELTNYPQHDIVKCGNMAGTFKGLVAGPIRKYLHPKPGMEYEFESALDALPEGLLGGIVVTNMADTLENIGDLFKGRRVYLAKEINK